MAQKFANAARGLLASAIGSGATTIEITEGGSLFPATSEDDWFKAVLQDADGIEIVRVNARSGNTFTVVRGQEGTTARSFAQGSVFGQRVTAGDMEDRAVYPSAGIPVSTGTAWETSKAAPAGEVVGTTDTQTLTGKTLGNYTEAVFAITDGTTVNLDPNNGPVQTWTLGANRTPGQANWAAGQSITLMVDDGTARTITWTTLAVVWKTDGGSAPTLNTDGFTVIALWKVGTTIYGARVGDA
jgi:hypothetical protein